MATAAVPQPEKKANAVLGFLRTAFPFISAGLSATGPVGALAGSIFGKAIGATQAPATPQEAEASYAEALSKAQAPAELIAKAQQAEMEFKQRAAEMGFDTLAKLETLAVQDRADARARQIAVRDRTPQVGFYLLLAMFVSALALLVFHSVPDTNKAMVFGMIGSLGTLVVMAATFFYGTTVGSTEKNRLLAMAGPVDADKVAEVS